jgi:hypothetical protein
MMATEEEIDEVCDELNEYIADVADDMERFSQQESYDIYVAVATACQTRATLIKSEMGG